MKMALKTRRAGDVVLVDISGRIQLGPETSAFRDMVRELVETSQFRILLNLADVSYIDSCGIGELVSAFTRITGAGGEIKLVNVSRRMTDLLQTTKLYTVFEVFDDEADAKRSFTAEVVA